MPVFDKLVSLLIWRRQVQDLESSGSRTCFSQPVQVCCCVCSWSLVAAVAEEGEGVVGGGGGGDWVLGVVGWSVDVLALHVLVIECTGEWVDKDVALVTGHHGFLGFVLVAASRQDGGEAMHVGW